MTLPYLVDKTISPSTRSPIPPTQRIPQRSERRVSVVYFSVCVHTEKLNWHLGGTDLLGRFVCRLRWWQPNTWGTRLWMTPSSHSRKGRISRVNTYSTCLIGGSQTVQHYQDSRTCCVQYWPTHTALVHLSIPLASSMRLPMTIRSRHTPTTLNYPCRPSLTNDPCSLRVSR